ncbi:glycerophosphodiester phosphodiesterase family protein [Spirochaeta dissipatitropha]
MIHLRNSWYDVWTARKIITAWNLLFIVVSVFLLTPLSSLLLSVGLAGQSDQVVANTDLLSFILTPLGAAWAILSTTIAAALAALRFSGIAIIIDDQAKGHRPSLFRTVVRAAVRAPALGRLSLLTALALMLMTAVLCAGLGFIYAVFLGDYDINYYLSVQPSEWIHALTAAGIWFLVWVSMIVLPLGKSLLAFPAVLFSSQGAWPALRSCWNHKVKATHSAAVQIALSMAGFILLRIIVDTVAAITARQAVLLTLQLSPWLRPVIAVVGLAALGIFFLDTLISITAYSCTSAVLYHSYISGQHGNNFSKSQREKPVHGPTSPSISSKQRRKLYYWLSPRRLFPLGTILLIISLSIGSLAIQIVPEARESVISAHRTGPPPSPENTLAALESAISAGADYTEIDVQITVDGSLPIVHDADLMRVARDPRQVRNIRKEEMQNIIKFPDDGSPPAERRLASLGEFLDRGADRIRFMIELKYYGYEEQLAEAVVKKIRERGMEDQVVLMSLSRRAIDQLRQIAPDIPLGFVSSLAVGDLQRLPVKFLAVHQQAVTASLLRRAQARGIEVYAWTVNDPAAMASLIVLGVDGLITDDPDRAVQIRDTILQLSPFERALIRFGIGTEQHLE